PLLVICVSVPPRQASLFPYTTLFRSSNTLPLARGAEPLGVALDIAARLSCVTDVCWRSWYPKKRWTLPSGDQTRGRPSELSPPQAIRPSGKATREFTLPVEHATVAPFTIRRSVAGALADCSTW